MFLKILILVICSFPLFSCSKKSSEVVVYTSVDQVFSEPILKDFEQTTGILVKPVFDTEETKSTGVLNRLIAETDNPQCDVFWSGDPVRAILLKNKGITASYFSPNAAEIPAGFKDRDGHWTGFSSRARVLLYNTNLVKPQEEPKSMHDFVDVKWKGQCTIANSLFGTTSFHAAALFSVFGDSAAKEFFAKLKANEVIIATSNGDVRKRVADGHVAFGLTDTDDANEAMKEGKPVQMVFPDQDRLGALIVPNTVSLIKNSPNQENGKKLIDYLLTREVEAKLAQSCVQMPLLPNPIAEVSGVTSVDKIVPMQIDYERTAQKLEEIQPFLKEWTGN
ncbi:extracellular solute-binding protein [candidate division KSB1 bacterium]|nr:extracellular solute-binding protein [candidate division KSB1 bacterium]